MSTVSEKKKPVTTFGPFRSGGGSTIEIAVWQNEGTGDNAGRKFYGVSFARSYYDGKDANDKDRFEKTTSLRPQDLPVLVHGLELAYSWVLQAQISDRAGKPEVEEEEGGDTF